MSSICTLRDVAVGLEDNTKQSAFELGHHFVAHAVKRGRLEVEVEGDEEEMGRGVCCSPRLFLSPVFPPFSYFHSSHSTRVASLLHLLCN